MPGIMTIYLGAYKNWEITASIALGVVAELQATASDGRQMFTGPGLLGTLLKAIDDIEAAGHPERSEE